MIGTMVRNATPLKMKTFNNENGAKNQLQKTFNLTYAGCLLIERRFLISNALIVTHWNDFLFSSGAL